jgi:hypothetical protein
MKGKYKVMRQTIRTRMLAKLQELKEQLRCRMHAPIPETGAWLRAVVRGHFQYIGVPGNQPLMSAFRQAVVRMWKHVLRRRSQTSRINWARMKRIAARWLPPVRKYHPYPSERHAV